MKDNNVNANNEEVKVVYVVKEDDGFKRMLKLSAGAAVLLGLGLLCGLVATACNVAASTNQN